MSTASALLKKSYAVTTFAVVIDPSTPPESDDNTFAVRLANAVAFAVEPQAVPVEIVVGCDAH